MERSLGKRQSAEPRKLLGLQAVVSYYQVKCHGLTSPRLCDVTLQCQEHLRVSLSSAHSACICLCIFSIGYDALNNKLAQPFKGASPALGCEERAFLSL